MGRKKNKWKGREGVVYSTSDDYSYQYDGEDEEETLPPKDQLLRISLDKKARAGKKVTLVDGFTGTEDDLKELAKTLKQACGVGGSAKNGEILIQGDFRDKVADILSNEGYGVKKLY